ncbi:MAG: hypothetical protein ABSE93_23475 [Terriglobia bacterium]
MATIPITLEAEVKALLAEAARVDAEEDRWPTRPKIAPHPALRDTRSVPR